MSNFNEVANLRAAEVQVLAEPKKTLGAGFTKPYGHASLFIDHWDTELRRLHRPR
ncbi:hypothetical protein [Streptomyces sp. NPDC002491]